MTKFFQCLVSVVMLALVPMVQAPDQTTLTWDGGGKNNDTDTSGNWNPKKKPSNGDFLIFGGSVRTLPQLVDDLTVGSIMFNNTAAAFTIGGSSTFTVTAGGIINNDANNQTINTDITLGAAQTWTANSGDLTFGGVLNKNNQGLIIDGGFNTTISGIVSSGGTLTKNGTGTLVLSGANTFSGATTVNAGALTLRHNTALGTSVGSTTINSGGALELQNTISVSGESLTLAGTGVSAGGALRNLANNNTWSGAITLGTGGARINSDSGTLTLPGNISVATGPLTIGGAGNVTISGVIGTTSGSLTKDGNGTITLSGANTYTGGTTISAGTLALGASDRLADGGAVAVSSGATFNLAGFNETMGALSGAGNVTLGSGTLTGGDNTSTTFSGVISGSNGNVTKAGSGTLTLSGANTYTGTTTINAGAVRVQNNTALGTTAGNTTVASGAAIQVSGNGLSIAEVVGSLIGTGISSSGALRNLANNNTWSGTLTLGAGGSRINSDSGILTLSGNISGATQPLTVGGSGDVTISSIIGTTSGTLTKDGNGTLILSGANTYTGTTTVSAGTLKLGASGAVSDSSAVSVSSGATFDLNGNNETVGSLAGAGNVTLGSANLIAGGANTSTAHSGVTSGSGGLTKQGSGTLTLSGANTYTGATTISAGTLQLGASGVINDSSAVSVASGAIFDLNGKDETVGSLAGAGNVTLGSANLIAGGANTSTTHSGVISGTGGLTKRGTGTLILSGINTYTGATAIDAGVLRISGSVANSAFAINNGGTLSGNGTIGTMVVNGGGTIAPGMSPGTLSSGAQTWAGGGNYLWEINKANGTKGADPGWDFLNISGALTVNATSGSKFNIGLTSLTLANESGQASSFDNTQNYAWTIATASGGLIGFDALKFNLDVSTFQNALGGGSFGIGQSGNDLNLTFTAVPEPHEYALVVGLGLLGFAIWRRRHQQRPAGKLSN